MPVCNHRILPLLLPLWLLLDCGGSGGGPAAQGGAGPAPPVQASSGPFALTPATLTLPVPPLTTQDTGSAEPYCGTVAITVNWAQGFTGPVTLAVDPATVPPGVKADLAETLLTAGAGTAVLSIQAGYPGGADPSALNQVYPALGSYAIGIQATAPGQPGSTGVVALNLVPEAPDFTLSWFVPGTRTPTVLTSIDLLPGTPVTLPIMAYPSRGVFAAQGPVTLSVANVPAALQVLLDGQEVDHLQVSLGDLHNVTLQALPGLAPGACSLQLRAEFQGRVHALPVVANFAPAPFAIVPPKAARVSVAPGQTVTVPLHLWHDDIFFAPGGGADPDYVGATLLAVTGALPAGVSLAFADADPMGSASTPLIISAGLQAAPGAYPVQLQATRIGAGPTLAPPLPLEVDVSSPGSEPTVWIQDTEWGQTVMAPDLRLVGGKPALLRVLLLADRPGVAAPAVTATIQGPDGGVIETLTLQGPAQVPLAVDEGDLPAGETPSSTSYTALLASGDVQPGMQVVLQAGSLAPLTLTPAVATGPVLPLTVVPVIHAGLVPVLPADADMVRALMAFYPLQSVNLAHRAPYTTATVLPPPYAAANGDGWSQLLSELASLRTQDGATSSYYGFVNPAITPPVTWSITGISHLGDGVGLGIDEAAEHLFRNSDTIMELAVEILVHEVGHAFNLNHAPAGGAGNPQLDYPYLAASIGSWGFDPVSGTAHAPDAEADVMSYAERPHWISDWDYRNAQGFLDQADSAAQGTAGADLAPGVGAEQWVVSGWINPKGQIHLLPLARVVCAPAAPAPGPGRLLLTQGGATRAISFATAPVPDLPPGHRHFHFTVPATGELASVEVRIPGAAPLRRKAVLGLAARTGALRSAVAAGSLVVRENGDLLHLEWDARVHPSVQVRHEGARRTTLALDLAGGSADLPLTGLPAGGRFVIQYSDGLNPVALTVGR